MADGLPLAARIDCDVASAAGVAEHESLRGQLPVRLGGQPQGLRQRMDAFNALRNSEMLKGSTLKIFRQSPID